MAANENYFLSGNRAYRSEIALFRHERITADNCMVVRTRQGADTLYLVGGRRGAITVAADLGQAWDAFLRTKARELLSIAVLG